MAQIIIRDRNELIEIDTGSSHVSFSGGGMNTHIHEDNLNMASNHGQGNGGHAAQGQGQSQGGGQIFQTMEDVENARNSDPNWPKDDNGKPLSPSRLPTEFKKAHGLDPSGHPEADRNRQARTSRQAR